MSQEKVVSSHVVSDLEGAGLETDCLCELPDTFTQNTMPVLQSNIPRTPDLQRWPRVKSVKVPEIDLGTDLLIGTNAPKALQPWEVV